MNFEAILKDLMDKQERTKQSIAQEAGITTRLLNYYLRGERKPTLATADRLLRAMGKTLTIGGEPKCLKQS